MKWFFYKIGRTIELRARAEGPPGSGIIGDAFHVMVWGDPPFFGVRYGELNRARGGVLEVSDDGVGRIVEDGP